MSKTPEIPNDRPSSWIVDEDGNWTETDFIVVAPAGNYDDFGPADSFVTSKDGTNDGEEPLP